MAKCPECKKYIVDFAVKCPHCDYEIAIDTDKNTKTETNAIIDTFAHKFSRMSCVSAILIIVWDYHIFTATYYTKSLGELIRVLLFIPLYISMIFFIPSVNPPSPYLIIADWYGGGQSILGILIFTLISLPAALFYSYIILRFINRFSSYSDEGEYYPSITFFKLFGVIFCIVFATTFIKYPAPPLQYHDRACERISCTGNLKQIGLALRMYSNAYDNQFPPFDGEKGLRLLVDDGFLENKNVYMCYTVKFNNRWNKERKEAESKGYIFDYEYKGGLMEDDENPVPICWDRPGNHTEYGNILYTDGHVKYFEGKEWMKNIKPLPVEKEKKMPNIDRFQFFKKQ